MTTIEIEPTKLGLDEPKSRICHISRDWFLNYTGLPFLENEAKIALCGADVSNRKSHSREECESNPLHSRCIVCMDLAGNWDWEDQNGETE